MLRKNSRQLHILEAISAGDHLVGFLFSGRSTKRMYQIARKRAMERYRNKLALRMLQHRGYVQPTKRGYLLTHEGQQALKELGRKRSERYEKWDGMWRIVAYDFPERERSTRNSLRHVLENAQFVQVQKSVWISPFGSILLQELLKENDVVTRHTLCMLVSKISYETKFKKLFKI